MDVHRFFISIPFIGITRKYMPNLTFIINDPFNPSSLSFSRPQDYSCAHFLLMNRKIIHAHITFPFYRPEGYSCARSLFIVRKVIHAHITFPFYRPEGYSCARSLFIIVRKVIHAHVTFLSSGKLFMRTLHSLFIVRKLIHAHITFLVIVRKIIHANIFLFIVLSFYRFFVLSFCR